MSNVVEIVSFKLIEGANAEKFVNSAEPINAWVQRQKGYQSRSLSVDKDGVWTDIVFWDSIETAEIASQKFMESNGDTEFMKMIDPSTLKMGHSDVKLMKEA